MKFVGKESIVKRAKLTYKEEVRIINGQEIMVKVYEAEKSPDQITGLESAFLSSLKSMRSI